jgi:uncharacterized protein (DUF1800 family)
MAFDEELFFARRLGLGLKQGETISGDVRNWAVEQFNSIPKLDFYGPDGRSISSLPPEAKPSPNFNQACREWEIYKNDEDKVFKEMRAMSGREADEYNYKALVQPYQEIPRWRDCLGKTLTALHGPSPVFERFWMFWLNHFTVSTTEANIKQFYGPHTRNIRNRMIGNFSDLLIDAILNPAMLVYLDNHLSTGPNSPQGRSGRESLNENLAREVLELHTMSPAAGFTQRDVGEAALVLTGWQFYSGAQTHGRRLKGVPYGTYFHWEKHEPGTRKVFGKTYKPVERGKGQAPAMLRDLAASPQTAQFLSWKLARHFIADVPPEDSVDRIRTAWMDSKGELVVIYGAVIDEVLKKALDNPKFATPENWLLQSYRVTGVEPPFAKPSYGIDSIDVTFKELGQAYDECPQPNGWSDTKKDWISKELLDRRLRYSFGLGRRIKNEKVEFLKDFSSRLGGVDSTVALMVARAETAAKATAYLLSSPQFLRI